VRLAVADVDRVTDGAKDPLNGRYDIDLAPLVREQVKAKAVELGADPMNIGLPDVSAVRQFKRDGASYVGKITIDFYAKPE
jgi:hypothetical protein